MNLSKVAGEFAVCRFEPSESIPAWILESEVFFVGRTSDELSIVCDVRQVPSEIEAERGWKAFSVEGPLDFSLTGILSSIAQPLAKAKIAIFAVSTFDTDYVLVKSGDFDRCVTALTDSGFCWVN